MRENTGQKNSEYGHFSCTFARSILWWLTLHIWYVLTTNKDILSATVKEPITTSRICDRLRLKMKEQHRLSHSDMSIICLTNLDCFIFGNAFQCFRRALQLSEFRLVECWLRIDQRYTKDLPYSQLEVWCLIKVNKSVYVA